MVKTLVRTETISYPEFFKLGISKSHKHLIEYAQKTLLPGDEIKADIKHDGGFINLRTIKPKDKNIMLLKVKIRNMDIRLIYTLDYLYGKPHKWSDKFILKRYV